MVSARRFYLFGTCGVLLAATATACVLAAPLDDHAHAADNDAGGDATASDGPAGDGPDTLVLTVTPIIDVEVNGQVDVRVDVLGAEGRTEPVILTLDVSADAGSTIGAAGVRVEPGATFGTLTIRGGGQGLRVDASVVAVLGSRRGVVPLRIYVHGKPGTFDTSFGTGGVAEPLGAGSVSLGGRVAAHGDGVVVAATQGTSLAVARLVEDGSLDTTYA